MKSMLFKPELVKAILEGRKTETRRVIKPQPTPCSHCGGQGWYEDVEAGHACDGTEQVCSQTCPVPIPCQTQCPCVTGFEDLAKPRYQVGDTVYVKERWGYLGGRSGGTPDINCKSVIYHSDGEKRDVLFDNFEAMANAGPHQNIKHKPDCEQDYECRWMCDCHSKWWARQERKSPLFMPEWAARLFLQITEVRCERLQGIKPEDCEAEGIEGVTQGSPVRGQPYETYTNGDGLEYGTPKEAFESLWDSIHNEHTWDSNPHVWVYKFKRIERPV